MIDIETLKKIARTKGIKSMGYAEKDYFQEIIMLGVSREAPELVFKGGTALYKFHNLDRFSEDLDFSGKIGRLAIRRVASYLENFGYKASVSAKEMGSATLLTFTINGFLYQGTPESAARIRMDISSENAPALKTEWLQFFSLYQDIPAFRLQLLDLKEVLSEKVSALITRKKTRDAYDIWFLLGRGVSVDAALIDKKLKLYGAKLNEAALNAALDECERDWDKELTLMMTNGIKFGGVRRRIREALGNR
ncbi:MAG: nucleotidyl transferase AbiEii/AbiGii toxin family protein [Thermoplasmata archaeon]